MACPNATVCNHADVSNRTKILGINSATRTGRHYVALGNKHVRTGTEKKTDSDGEQEFHNRSQGVPRLTLLTRRRNWLRFLMQLLCRLPKKKYRLKPIRW